MANKRIKKKRTQQRQRANLTQSGYSAKEVKQLRGSDLAQASAKVDRQNKYNDNRQYLLSLGIDKSIISKNQLYRRTDKFLQDKKNITKWKRETRELNRYRQLIEAGYKKDEIKKSWLRSDRATLEHIPGEAEYIVYKNKWWLLVMFADVMGDGNIDSNMYANFTMDELITSINERYEESYNNLDGSDKFGGVFKIMFSDDIKGLRLLARSYDKRGYNLPIGKFDRETYSTVTIKNDFTLREFAEMTLIILENTGNAETVSNYKTLRAYSTGFTTKKFRQLFKYND